MTISTEQLSRNIDANRSVYTGLTNISKMIKYEYEYVFAIYAQYYNAASGDDGVEKECRVLDIVYDAAQEIIEQTQPAQPTTAEEVVEVEKVVEVDSNDHQHQKLNRICVSGLPKYNFAYMYMIAKNMKSIKPEFNYQNAVCGLSSLILGNVRAKTQNAFGEYFSKPLTVNSYSLIFGGSADGKTESHDGMRDIIIDVMGHRIFADNTSPEQLAKDLSDIIIKTYAEKSTDDETGVTTERLVERQVIMPESDYPRGHKVLWNSEFGTYLELLSKPYMAGTKQAMCDYYSRTSTPKKNAGDKQGDSIRYIIEDSCFGINGCTTPISLKSLAFDDIGSGFVPRFDIIYNDVKIKYDSIELGYDPQTEITAENLFARLDEQKAAAKIETTYDIPIAAVQKAAEIVKILLRNQSIIAEFDDECFEIITRYERKMRKHFADDPFVSLYRSRDMENIYKQCISLEVGNLPWYIVNQKDLVCDGTYSISKEYDDITDIPDMFTKILDFDISKLENVRISRLAISRQTVLFVLKMYDRIYFPSKALICNKLRADIDEKSPISKTIKRLENSDVISKGVASAACEKLIDAYTAIRVKHDQRSVAETKIVNTHIKSKFTAEQYNRLAEDVQAHAERLREALKDMSNDVIITQTTTTDIMRSARLTPDELKRALSALSASGNVLVYPISTQSVGVIYIPFGKHVILPQVNYENYKYDGKYLSGVILQRVEPVPEPQPIPKVQMDDVKPKGRKMKKQDALKECTIAELEAAIAKQKALAAIEQIVEKGLAIGSES